MGRLKTTYLPALVVAFLVSFGLSSVATVEVLYLFFSLDGSFAMIGSILGLSALAFVFLSAHIQKIASRMGYGLFFTWSSLALSCALVFASLAVSAGMYAVSRVIIAVGTPLLIPLVIDLVRDAFRFAKDLDRLVSVLLLAVSLGGAAGALSAGVVAQEVSYSYVYVLSAIAFFSAGMVALMLPQTRPSFPKRPFNPFSEIAQVMQKKYLVLAVFSLQAFWVVRDMVLPFFILDIGGSVLAVGVVFASMSLLAGIGGLFARQVLGKNASSRVLVFSFAGMSACALLFPFSVFVVLVFVAGAYAFFDASASPSVHARIEKDTPLRRRPAIVEGFRALSSLALVVTPVVLGLLLEAGLPLRLTLLFSGVALGVVYFRLQKQFAPDEVFPRLRVRKRFSW